MRGPFPSIRFARLAAPSRIPVLVLGGLAVALVVAVSVPSRAAEAGDIFRVTDVEGDVSVYSAGADAPAVVEEDFPLREGDRIVTSDGARAEISTKDGTVIELQGGTDFELETAREDERSFFMRAGKIFSAFSRLKRKIEASRRPTYQVRTVVAVGSVRGTELLMALDESGELEAAVLEGEVAFEPADRSGTESEWEEPVSLTPETPALVMSRHGLPRRLDRPSKLVVSGLNRMERLRERIPKIATGWERVSPEKLRTIRARSLKNEIERPQIRRVLPGRPNLRKPPSKRDRR